MGISPPGAGNIFVKTNYVSVVSWFQEITSIILDVILHKTSFITPLSGCRALTYPLHLNLFSLILSLTLYQLVGNFTCNYLTQPILENAYLLIGITFTSIRNMTKRAYPFTNPPNFTLSLTFPWIICNALMSLLQTILTARD